MKARAAASRPAFIWNAMDLQVDMHRQRTRTILGISDPSPNRLR